MKEWRCKDVMMEDHQNVTSLDASRKRNPPQGCSRPRDSTPEDIEVLHRDECEEQTYIKVEVKEEEEEEEEEVCVNESHPTAEKNETMMAIKEEESSPDISTNGSRKRNPPQKCPRPRDSRDSTPEDHTYSLHLQDEKLKYFKVVVKEEEEETSVSGAPQSMEEEEEMMVKSEAEEPTLYIDTNGRCVWNINASGGDLFPSLVCAEDNGSARHPHNRHPRNHRLGGLMDASTSHVHLNPGKATGSAEPSLHPESSLILERGQQVDHSVSFFACGDSCAENRVQTEHPFSCSECGKCFINKTKLQRHKKTHKGDRPYSCAECEKCFLHKRDLIVHQRHHTGERPFSCTDCGRSFTDSRLLLRHRVIHTGEYPFFCSVCGKGFVQKGDLTIHQRIHTGERPFSCSECGKGFRQRALLFRHLKVHTGEHQFL